MNPLVKKYGESKRWVNYKIVHVNDKLTKVPFAITGKKASSIDEKTWSTYLVAKNKSNNVGIIFTADQTLLGIDIDHCLVGDKIVHEKKDIIEKLIVESNTYTEISPSKTGLHLFFTLTEPFTPLANKKEPFELYTKGRYFTVTENPYKEAKDVRVVTPSELTVILSLIGYPWAEEVVVSQSILSPISLDDDIVLKKMFAARNGKSLKSLYSGDISIYNGDESRADMALCLHLAFWTGNDATQIERLWTNSPLGARKKTQDRVDYRKRTIASAIKKCASVYSVPVEKKEQVEKAEKLELLFTINQKGDKTFVLNTENICRILRHHEEFRGSLRYDSFKNIIEVKHSKWRCIEDNDAVIIQTRISILFPYFGKVVKGMVFDAMIKVAQENSVDSAADYIKSLTWDGIKRLDYWLSETYGAKNDALNRAIGSNWIKGMVKRIIEPGCKFDYVLVLEGKQGTKKSTSLYILGGDWHMETAMSTDTKDFFMQFQGKSIIEFSEGETLSRTEVKRMKAIITMQSDKYRPPYERSSRDFPRRCVFAMTTNQEEYLKDETGNRRWLPVKLTLPQANIEWLKDNRAQLFAEAYYRVVNLNESIYEFPEEAMMSAQEERRISDPNADLIIDWYFNKLSDAQREEGISIFQVFRDAIYGGYTAKQLDKYNEMVIADTLKRKLLLVKKQVMKNNVRTMKWFMDQPLDAKKETKNEVEQIMDGIGW